MAPKKSDTEAVASDAATSSKKSHPTYLDMIVDAIVALKDRNGSSRQSIKKYVKANNTHNIAINDAMFDHVFNKALKGGVEKGVLTQPKGTSGPAKLAKPISATKKEKKAIEKKNEKVKEKEKEKKTAAPKKKSTTTKKEGSAIKASTTKKASSASTAKKDATRKTATTAVDKKKTTTSSKPSEKKTATGRVAKPKAIPTKKAAAAKATPTKKSPAKAKRAAAADVKS